jgi:hypothetical protein
VSVGVAAAVESVFFTVESGAVLTESVAALAAESTGLAAVLPLLLQAVIPPAITRIANTFFMNLILWPQS